MVHQYGCVCAACRSSVSSRGIDYLRVSALSCSVCARLRPRGHAQTSASSGARFGALASTHVMLQVLRRTHQLSSLGRSLTCTASAWANSRVQSDNHDVPEGHKNSDLRSVACHIGLNRRRDLSLREDLCLFQPGGKSTVREIFKVQLVVTYAHYFLTQL